MGDHTSDCLPNGIDESGLDQFLARKARAERIRERMIRGNHNAKGMALFAICLDWLFKSNLKP